MKRILAITLIGFGFNALALEQPAFEMSCRIKAKEVAADTYRGCVTENRKAQIDQIRSDYQTKLKSLKDEYDQELKKMSGGSSSSNSSELKESTQSLPTSSQLNPVLRKNSNKPAARVAGRALPGKRKQPKETALSSSNEDMTVQLRPPAKPGMSDDSTMDIPEPIPVENIQSSDSQI